MVRVRARVVDLRRDRSRGAEAPIPYLILGGAQLAVGAAAIFARYALEGASPLAVAATRLTIAALILGAIALVRQRHTSKTLTSRERLLLACAGCALAIHFATWIASLEYTSVAVSTLLVSTSPIFTASYDAIVHRRMLHRATLLAFLAGAIGLAMIVSYDRTVAPHTGAELFGSALALVGAIAIGAYLVLVREVRAQLDTRTIVTHTYSWAAVALVVAAALAHQAPPPLSATAAWGGILAMALISQLVGHTAMNYSLRWFSPHAIAFATVLEPVFAAALALGIFGESIPPLALLGGFIVLSAIAVVLWTDPKQELA